MDTKYWGPSGWKLLHSITFSYEEKLKNHYYDFFYVIAFLLPCKFCRKSYSEYITNDPIDTSSKEVFTKWFWRIHNKVNEKLRNQRLCKYNDPPFSEVKKFYEEKLSQGCSRIVFEGWEFLFSIVEAHPTSKLSLGSKPFDIDIEVNTPLLRNIYNVMEPEERLTYFKQFWNLLPKVLPFSEWRSAWNDTGSWDTRAQSLKNLYSIRCSLENTLELQNKTKFSSLCQELRSYKSGCNKSTRSKTCRSKKTRKLQQNGGEIIGKGMTGTVYYPALECKNSSETPKGDYVSKKSTIQNSLREFENTEKLRSLKPDNVIYPEYICSYNDTQNLLFSKFGGYSLVGYFDYLEDLAYKKEDVSNFEETYFSDVIASLYELKDSIKKLNNNDIYQGDISFDNIVYNEHKKKSYLIDFELTPRKKRDESALVQELIDDLFMFKDKIYKKK